MLRRFRNKSNSTPERSSGLSDLHPPQSSGADLHSRGRQSEALPPGPIAGSSPGSRSHTPRPAGLRILHQPDFASLDIIFVHGLGGHSQKTWSKGQHFWPQLWLPFEPGMESARISTFGYNASWRGATKTLANVTDFAKELLFELRYGRDEVGATLDIGKKPIVFVAHSMGGLVVKKAYLLGLHDETYKELIASFCSIIFLSTPHRGTELAKMLNRILSASFQSPKNFISDLARNSPAIDELNEQFRHVAPRLSIWSFYETLATPVGLKKIMILEKDSSVLGYPTEISRPLAADHNGVCKYSSPTDPNYVSVRNAIKSLVDRCRPESDMAEPQEQQNEEKAQGPTLDLQELFRKCPTSEDDFQMLRRLWAPETCGWLFEEPEVIAWIEPSGESRIMWYSARPASGKSVLSAFIIDHLRKLGLACEYFLFKYSDNTKRSVAACLRALAFQLTKEIPEFRERLIRSSAESLSLDSPDAPLIWLTVFESILYFTGIARPLYWVIDALDECEAPTVLLDCLKTVPGALIPIKVLVLSRNTDMISAAFDRISHVNPITRIEKTDQSFNQNDITVFLKHEIRHMRGEDRFKEQLVGSILARSESNFLWTRLVLDEIMECHTEEGVYEVLEEIPDNMTELYQRMEQSLISPKRRSNEPLIRILFEWTICAQRALTILELSQALRPEFSGFLDLRRTIKDTCGQFVQVDTNGRVSMLHYTAREYFTKSESSQFFINSRKTHLKLFAKTMAVLEEPGLRWRLQESQHALQGSEPFVFYAALNWSYHLSQSHSTGFETLSTLLRLFRSSAVLVWVHALALLRRLEVLVTASKVLSAFVRSVRSCSTSQNTMLHHISDLEVLDDWIVDLLKVVGKFGRSLANEPAAIYNVIPPLCPAKSALRRTFYNPAQSDIRVLGTRDDAGWDDRLGCYSLPATALALKVTCSGKYVAVLSSTNAVFIWNAFNFTETATANHGEPVTAIAIDSSGAKLITYGLNTTKLWSIPSGQTLTTITNPISVKAVSIRFSNNDSQLLMGGDDNVVRHIDCSEPMKGWQAVNPILLKETVPINGAIANSPICLAFNGDGTQVGVSYRGAPLSIWRLSDGRCINRCRRARGSVAERSRFTLNWFAVKRFTWNTVTNHVLGLYGDGCLFKWHPVTDENIEARTGGADEIAASPNGKIFATSNTDGSVRVWSFARFNTIYRLSTEDLVIGLTFSPDSSRFYDLRGGSVNAWEPSSLTRFLEDEENDSDTKNELKSSTVILKTSGSLIARSETVTAFSAAPDGGSYCAGYEDGSVLFFEKGSTEGSEIWRFYNFLDVTHIRWSYDGKRLALADLAGEVQILALHHIGTKTPQISPIHAPRIDLQQDNIADIFFDNDGNLLFLSTRKRAFVWSFANDTLHASVELDSNKSYKWVCQNRHNDVIWSCSADEIYAYSWDNLEVLQSASYSQILELSGGGMLELPESLTQLSLGNTTAVPMTIANAFPTRGGKDIIFWARSTGNRGSNIRLVISENSFPNQKDKFRSLPFLRPLHIPSHISSQINVPLGVLPGFNLAFLDNDLWFSVYPLATAAYDVTAEYSRLYFIPRDWIGRVSFDQCALAEDGTMFWPKNDQVISIECDLDDAKISSWN